MNMEVKTIWREMVKPMDPTPYHLKTLKLSVLDQLSPLCHIPTLLFYSAAPSSSSCDLDQVMNMMKTSLSKTLSQFYPVAGRFLDDSTLICDDQGVLLIHTRVTCSLKSYFSLLQRSIYSDEDDHLLHHHQDEPLLIKLLPPRDSLHGSHQNGPIPISAWVQFAIQVNIFECGGVVIGWYGCHKLMDGTSVASFLRHWAGLSLGLGPEQLVQPNFDNIVAAFPPYDDYELARKGGLTMDERVEETLQLETTTTTTATATNITCKSFVFKPTNINAIREKAVSDRVPKPTRIESVVAFVWKHSFEAEAKAMASELVGPTELALTVDMRRRAQPPLPWESMGNLATCVVARAEKRGLGLADLVAEIRGAIHEFNDNKMKEFQSEKGGEAWWNWMQIAHQSSGYTPSSYVVSCRCGNGFADLDFGFGKPIWMCPLDEVHPMLRNLIIIIDHIDSSQQAQGNGIEAWLFLDKKEMQVLETNPDFLAFASPLNPSIN